MTIPTLSYFPLPLTEKLEEKFSGSAYLYCKSKLQSMVTELKLRKDRNRFHFYFGDSLELCITNEEWKKKFHVIHCPAGFIGQIELINILPIVNKCLSSDMPEAVLVTEFPIMNAERKNISMADLVELQLECPLAMIPTVYGMKLLDHLRLGSSVCLQLHDGFFSANGFILKWNKAPAFYSTNIQLEISPALIKVIDDLVNACLSNAELSFFSSTSKNDNRALFFKSEKYPRKSPLTLYNILQPLFNCYNWVERTVDSVILLCIPPPHRLAWKSLQQWMNGEEVLLFYTTDKNMRDAILSETWPDIGISYVGFALKPVETKTRYRPGQIVDEDFYSDAHCVSNLNWKESNDFAVSFFLAKNHRFGSTLKLFAIDYGSNRLLYSTSLTSQSMQRQVVINPNPRQFSRPPSNPSIHPLQILSCQESDEDYKLVVRTRKIKLQSLEGILLAVYNHVLF